MPRWHLPAYNGLGAQDIKSSKTFTGNDGGATEDERTLVIIAHYADANGVKVTRGKFLPLNRVREMLGEIPLPVIKALRGCRLELMSQEDFEEHLHSRIDSALKDAGYKDAEGNPL